MLSTSRHISQRVSSVSLENNHQVEHEVINLYKCTSTSWFKDSHYTCVCNIYRQLHSREAHQSSEYLAALVKFRQARCVGNVERQERYLHKLFTYGYTTCAALGIDEGYVRMSTMLTLKNSSRFFGKKMIPLNVLKLLEGKNALMINYLHFEDIEFLGIARYEQRQNLYAMSSLLTREIGVLE